MSISNGTTKQPKDETKCKLNEVKFGLIMILLSIIILLLLSRKKKMSIKLDLMFLINKK